MRIIYNSKGWNGVLFLDSPAPDGGAMLTLFDCLGDAVSIQDADFRILFQNRAHRAWIGDHVGKLCYEAYYGMDTVCEGCPVSLVFEDEKIHSMVCRGPVGRRDEYIEITASSFKMKGPGGREITAGVEVARDITGRAVIGRQRDESRKMLESVVHGISESILLLAKDRKILWANDAAKRQIGQNVVGEFCYRATHHRGSPCDASGEPCPLGDLQIYETPQFIEHTHYDENGDICVVEAGAYPIRNEAGEVDSFVYISRDITARKRLEAEKERLIEELRVALANVRRLTGLLPICMHCKKIRDDKGYWKQIEAYISEHSEAEFTHGLCPECRRKYYPFLG